LWWAAGVVGEEVVATVTVCECKPRHAHKTADVESMTSMRGIHRPRVDQGVPRRAAMWRDAGEEEEEEEESK
jgi:hypothetical protein